MARHVAAGRVAHDDQHRPAVGAREKHSQAEQDERQRRVQGHTRVGRDAIKERDLVEVADEGQQGDEEGCEGEELCEAVRALRPRGEEQQRATDEKETQRRVRRRASGERHAGSANAIAEQQRVNLQV